MADYLQSQSVIDQSNERFRQSESLVNMYMKVGMMDEARELLKEMHSERKSKSKSKSAPSKNDSSNDELVIELDDPIDEPPNPSTPVAKEYDPTMCIDCQLMPSNHTCIECGAIVCSICCDKKSGLQGQWCCVQCFNQHSPTTRELNKNGQYDKV